MHIGIDDRICDKIADILLVPKDYEVVCILPVGVAESEPLAPKKKVFEERAWFNTFKGRQTIILEYIPGQGVKDYQLMIREAKKEDLEALLELYLYLHEDSIPDVEVDG